MRFSDLPVEIALKIFSYLDVGDLLTIGALNKSSHDVIRSSSLIQYLSCLQTTGQQDESALFDTHNKLERLRGHEQAWGSLDLGEPVTVQVTHRPSNVYDLSGGVYVLGDRHLPRQSRTTTALRYVDLSAPGLRSFGEEFRSWPRLALGVNIVDFGLALTEHDLLAAITSERAQRDDHQIFVAINLHLKQFSTGANHPSAAEPIIALTEYAIAWSLDLPSVMIEIVGQYLLLLLTRPFSELGGDDLYLFDWMTGELLDRRQSEKGTWTGFAFLTPESAVVPNLLTKSLDILHIAPSKGPNGCPALSRIRALALPETALHQDFTNIGCRADPNPFGRQPAKTHGRPQPPRPFSAAPEKAIVLFHCYVENQPGMRPTCFSFVVHRAALLRVAYMHGFGAWAGVDDAPPVPWEEWGPANTRWGDVDDDFSRWITITAGQREVMLKDGKFVVKDYNPYAVRRALAELARTVNGEGASRVRVVIEPTVTVGRTHFTSNIETYLPYVEITSEQEYPYEDVMMDEERIIGVTTSEAPGGVDTIGVFTLTPRDVAVRM